MRWFALSLIVLATPANSQNIPDTVTQNCAPIVAVQMSSCELVRAFRCSDQDSDVIRYETIEYAEPPFNEFYSTDHAFLGGGDPDFLVIPHPEKERTFSLVEMLETGQSSEIYDVDVFTPVFVDAIKGKTETQGVLTDQILEIDGHILLQADVTLALHTTLGLGTVTVKADGYVLAGENIFFSGRGTVEAMGNIVEEGGDPVSLAWPDDNDELPSFPQFGCGETS